jgi:hypothetical protein
MASLQFSADHLQIHYCGIISFEIRNEDDSPLRPKDIEQYHFTVQTKLGVAQGNWLRVLLKVDSEAQAKEKDNVRLKGSITTECLFQIVGLDELLQNKPNEPIPQPIAVTAVSIAYSTTRGLLASRASGTFLEGAVLPIVQPVKLLAPEQPVLQCHRFNF